MVWDASDSHSFPFIDKERFLGGVGYILFIRCSFDGLLRCF